MQLPGNAFAFLRRNDDGQGGRREELGQWFPYCQSPDYSFVTYHIKKVQIDLISTPPVRVANYDSLTLGSHISV